MIAALFDEHIAVIWGEKGVNVRQSLQPQSEKLEDGIREDKVQKVVADNGKKAVKEGENVW